MPISLSEAELREAILAATGHHLKAFSRFTDGALSISYKVSIKEDPDIQYIVQLRHYGKVTSMNLLMKLISSSIDPSILPARRRAAAKKDWDGQTNSAADTRSDGQFHLSAYVARGETDIRPQDGSCIPGLLVHPPPQRAPHRRTLRRPGWRFHRPYRQSRPALQSRRTFYLSPRLSPRLYLLLSGRLQTAIGH